MSGRPTAVQVAAWADELAAVAGRIGRHFVRSEPRRQAAGYLLLGRAGWDADAVRDDLLGYVAEHLGDAAGVLVVDESGFLKTGSKSVGVARQYSGTAGRIENCQVGGFLGYLRQLATRHRRQKTPCGIVGESEMVLDICLGMHCSGKPILGIRLARRNRRVKQKHLARRRRRSDR